MAKGRVTPAEFDDLKTIMTRTGKSQSELVRRGVQLVIQEDKRAEDGAADGATDPSRGQ